MKHIQVYENFRDPLGRARDLFGLTSSFTRKEMFSAGKTIEFTGPVESEGEAIKIVDSMLPKIFIGLEFVKFLRHSGLDSIGWQAEMIAPVQETGYAIKGPLANWDSALEIMRKWDKDVSAYEEESISIYGNMSDADLENMRHTSYVEILEDEEIQSKCAEIGYRVIELPIT